MRVVGCIGLFSQFEGTIYIAALVAVDRVLIADQAMVVAAKNKQKKNIFGLTLSPLGLHHFFFGGSKLLGISVG